MAKEKETPTCESVLKERAGQYGSYLGNMKYIHAMISHHLIEIDFGRDYNQKNYCFEAERAVAQATINFAKTMLALKAARSFKAEGASFLDCVIDFLNYMTLTKQALGELGYVCEFIFNDEYFNPMLNRDSLRNATSIRFLANEKKVKTLIKE